MLFITSCRFYLFIVCLLLCAEHYYPYSLLSACDLLQKPPVILASSQRDHISCDLLLKWRVPLENTLSLSVLGTSIFMWYLCLNVIYAHMLFVLISTFMHCPYFHATHCHALYLCLHVICIHLLFIYMLYVLCLLCVLCYLSLHCHWVLYIVNASLFPERPCWDLSWRIYSY